MKQRQFGFTFLLFIPILAYWGYGSFRRWYVSTLASKDKSVSCKTNAGSDNVAHVTPSDKCEQASSVDVPSTTDKTDGTSVKPILQSPTADDYRQAFDNIQRGIVTPIDCTVLLTLLRSADTTKLADGLQLIMKLSVTSTENKNVILDNGIASQLKRIIRCRKTLPGDIVSLAISAVNNLLLNDAGQVLFTDIVSELTDCSLSPEETLALTSLKCLTNLSVTLHSHTNFIKVLHSLLNALDEFQERRLQICRVLVNLSCNNTLTPYLLAAKRPVCTTELLVGDDKEIARRWLRFMTNITQTVLADGITESSLPTIYKAASPETLYSHLYGTASHQELTDTLLGNKSATDDEELNMLINTLYKNLKLRILVPQSTVS